MITDYQHPQLFNMIQPRGSNTPGDFQAVFRFRNGYGASVIQNGTSYGGDSGLYELAVIRYMSGDDNDWELCYDTPLTGDVLGRLSSDRVEEILNDVAVLPPDAKALAGAMLC